MKSLHQTTEGLSSAIDSRGTTSQVRPYTDKTRPHPSAYVIEVIHEGTDWKPADFGSQHHCDQSYHEFYQDMMNPIRGVRMKDSKGKVIKEKVL